MKKIKKLFVVARNKENINKLKKKLKGFDFIFTKKNPDLIISFGGDGTYFIAERLFPGIPKILVRDSKVCSKCGKEEIDRVLIKLQKGQYKIKRINKLQAIIGKNKLVCINDFIFRNRNPSYALRFNLYVNNKKINNIIGDGVVISTVFGSSGYFYSITRKKFKKGIGIAFNNPTKPTKSLIVSTNSKIKIELLRYNAHFVADNNPKIINLKPKAKINIRHTGEKASILYIKGHERKLIENR